LRFRSTCRALLLVAMASFFSPSALAQAVDDSTRNAARSLASQGKEALDQADYERARDLFHRAYTLVPAPTIALYEGRALAKLQRLVEAEEALMRAARTSLDGESPEPFRKAVHDAEEDLVALQARMPKVTILPKGPGAGDPQLSVILDGRPLASALVGVELPINPGGHTLSAVAPGGQPAQITFSVAEKQRPTVELVVPAGHRQKRAGLIVGGVGVAGVLTGVITGLMAGSRYSKAERECPDRRCVEGSAGGDTVQSFRTLRTVSTVGYIIGGVGLAAGTTLYLIAPSPRSNRTQTGRLKLWVSASSAGLAGAF
jgi:hypothetical protein